MKKKIFIAVEIPNRSKKRLSEAVLKWKDLPVKWAPEANFHLTLAFLGFIDDQIIPDICEKVREAVSDQEIFEIDFEKVEWFPSETDPKLIALIGPPNPMLLNLVEKIEKALGIFESAKKSYRPHITLGRLRKHKWQALENKPIISENFSLIITADAVKVMTGDFGDGAQKYAILESCPLK